MFLLPTLLSLPPSYARALSLSIFACRHVAQQLSAGGMAEMLHSAANPDGAMRTRAPDGHLCARTLSQYDTCGSGNMSLGSDTGTPRQYGSLVNHMAALAPGVLQDGSGSGGGPPFSYPCGTGDAVDTWMNSEEVRKGIHMPPATFYGKPWPNRGMQYNTYTHASIDLWPSLIERFRTVIYNGDVDACVPYNGNEDWTAGLGLAEATPWKPWVVGNVPAGYVTTYKTTGPADLTFVTVKDAGHLVPGYQPERAYAMLQRFLAGKPF